ncbi:acyl-CoA dehydrogenase family protein [Allobacillus halotolerans]|uniref:Acyl-CoA dehydrogenase family protein n=1 Tax=Allobacillus halotolerans TaxID=570278 RepID=A0ABS6GTB5_9BACI|nr:acyl-CoA dehydrogenase family protein [Allobacillus halotolerans]MBU6081864.1 acyl-CoA dehydrogenase family protein [Allobacillus halotolerans]
MTEKNFYTSDPLLQKLLKRSLPEAFFAYADEKLTVFGERVAGAIDDRAVHTDREGQPQLIKYDKMGNEINEVWVNEGYRETVKETYETGIVGYVHKEIPELGHQGNYVYSYAQGYLLSQAEPGFYCPVTLTMATSYLIDHYADEALRKKYLPHVIATGDTELYEGATFLTERQGGSDVGANEVSAEAAGSDAYGEVYRITGEKYFASNTGMAGVAMVLARIPGAEEGTKGLSLFLVPWEENRVENRAKVRRLKDKLGVRAVPSAEVEFDQAKGYLVGDPKKGFKYMMEALNLSRVCNAIASLGIMRRGYVEARDYAEDRRAFGGKLTDYPMVRETLANLASKLEVEMTAIFELIERFDQVMTKGANPSEEEQAMLRLLIALLKKESAEQAIHFSHESIEMHGGNGYIEDFVTPRLLRDAQVLTVWEGTANILGLEVVRLMRKYNIHQTFVQEMSERLANLDSAAVSLKTPVEQALQKLTSMLEKLVQLDEQTQLLHPKKVAVQMTKIFEGVVALETISSEDPRSQAVSEVFLQQTFGSDADLSDAPLRHFDAIVFEKKSVNKETESVK